MKAKINEVLRIETRARQVQALKQTLAPLAQGNRDVKTRYLDCLARRLAGERSAAAIVEAIADVRGVLDGVPGLGRSQQADLERGVIEALGLSPTGTQAVFDGLSDVDPIIGASPQLPAAMTLG